MEFHDDYPQYELMAHHSEEEGKKARRKLWNVFWIMLAITIFELIIGSMAPGHGWSGHLWLKVLFISLTILKAGYIVMAFMHLGHEVKFMKYVILMPYMVFMSYCIFICLNEGTYSSHPGNKAKLDPILVKQQEQLKAGHHAGATEEAHEGAAEEHHGEEAHH
ncbi:MAG: cytochrome C oxidase subunit IV family protein [Bacteroidetes bacterium]|nr:cytochrome C oxidase subunit IV family protein [Bacteroidota bacterium]